MIRQSPTFFYALLTSKLSINYKKKSRFLYNEKLEELIDAALADGVLTEKEKQVLFKKAQESGCYRSNFRQLSFF